MINRLEARRRQAGADAPAAREAARALCVKYGIVTGGNGGALEKRNEVGETPLIEAAADGAALSPCCTPCQLLPQDDCADSIEELLECSGHVAGAAAPQGGPGGSDLRPFWR